MMGRYARPPAPALNRIGDPLTRVLGVLSARWGFLVLQGIADGHVRFNALQRHLTGISHKVLIDTLRMLQRDGFVRGPLTVGRSCPEAAEGVYELTEMGRGLLDRVHEIRRWAEERRHVIDRARADFESARP